MKFSQQLKFNSVADWKEFYLNYGLLKKIIYHKELLASEKRQPGTPTQQLSGFGGSARTSPYARRSLEAKRSLELRFSEGGSVAEEGELPSLEGLQAAEDQAFRDALERELARILAFYQGKAAELLQQEERLEQRRSGKDVEANTRESGVGDAAPLLTPFGAPAAQSTAAASHAEKLSPKERSRERAELRELYMSLFNLVEFAALNQTGFRKILKKHDKVTAGLGPQKMLPEFLPVVDEAFAKLKTGEAQAAMDRVVGHYAALAGTASLGQARDELNTQRRKQLVYERATVWKEMVGQERRRANARLADGPGAPLREAAVQAAKLGLAATVFLALLLAPTFPEPEKRGCLALLAGVSILWCTEALPLYVTSMVVPLGVVLLRVLRDDSRHHRRLSAPDAATHIIGAMFSQVIMLLLGGFAIAAALSKHFIAKRVATWTLARVGSRPATVLLANMLIATFMSMWISNVATPVLCYSLLDPILRTLHVGHPFTAVLVLGVALASNIGGMTSPISSPQNIFAIQQLSADGPGPSWLDWFAVALPVAVVGDLACWGILLAVYRPGRAISAVRKLPDSKDRITGVQWYVVGVSVATVALWCANSRLAPLAGNMGVISILPLVAFFGFGVLSKDDFNSFLWNVVMLAMGGSALGEAVKSSGLLAALAHSLEAALQGYGAWSTLAVFCAAVLVVATFISHTVAAMVILPVVAAVGAQMEEPHPFLLVMGAALTCSGAMGLPVSGFPNMTAVTVEDKTGQTYVGTVDFLKAGVPSSLVAYAVIVTLGYAIMTYGLGW